MILFLSELVIGVVSFALIPLLIRVRVDRGADAGWALSSSVVSLVGVCILAITLLLRRRNARMGAAMPVHRAMLSLRNSCVRFGYFGVSAPPMLVYNAG